MERQPGGNAVFDLRHLEPLVTEPPNRWSLNPREWLTRYLQSCAENGGKAPADITPFLPWNRSAENGQAATVVPTDSS